MVSDNDLKITRYSYACRKSAVNVHKKIVLRDFFENILKFDIFLYKTFGLTESNGKNRKSNSTFPVTRKQNNVFNGQFRVNNCG